MDEINLKFYLVHGFFQILFEICRFKEGGALGADGGGIGRGLDVAAGVDGAVLAEQRRPDSKVGVGAVRLFPRFERQLDQSLFIHLPFSFPCCSLPLLKPAPARPPSSG